MCKKKLSKSLSEFSTIITSIFNLSFNLSRSSNKSMKSFFLGLSVTFEITENSFLLGITDLVEMISSKDSFVFLSIYLLETKLFTNK